MARWSVPVYSQSSIYLCWEVCGKMMWHWRHDGLNGYTEKAGSYLNITTGLVPVKCDMFYKTLGLRSLPSPQGKNLRHALQWTPVIFTLKGKGPGHALIATEITENSYGVINPCSVESVSFEEGADSCQGAEVLLPYDEVDNSLGRYIWYW